MSPNKHPKKSHSHDFSRDARHCSVQPPDDRTEQVTGDMQDPFGAVYDGVQRKVPAAVMATMVTSSTVWYHPPERGDNSVGMFQPLPGNTPQMSAQQASLGQTAPAQAGLQQAHGYPANPNQANTHHSNPRQANSHGANASQANVHQANTYQTNKQGCGPGNDQTWSKGLSGDVPKREPGNYEGIVVEYHSSDDDDPHEHEGEDGEHDDGYDSHEDDGDGYENDGGESSDGDSGYDSECSDSTADFTVFNMEFPTWPEADFKLFTSDKRVFHVPSQLLFNASPEFRDRTNSRTATFHRSRSGMSLAFDEREDRNNSCIIHMFLRLARDGEFDDGPYAARAHLLVTFLQEWRCAKALKSLVKTIVLSAQPGARLPVAALRAFAVCAAAFDVDACAIILRTCEFGERSGQEVWPSPKEQWAHDCANVHPNLWPMYMHSEVPPALRMALAHGVIETEKHMNSEDCSPDDRLQKGAQVWLSKAFVRYARQLMTTVAASHLVFHSGERMIMECEG